MHRSLRAASHGLILIVLALFGNAATVQAAASTNTITISPFLSEVQIQPDDTSKDIAISISNTTGERQSFDVSAVDFGSLGATGGLAFAGGNVKAFTQKYGLAQWLHLSTDHLNLEPGKSTVLIASVLNDETLGPGGHYASIILTVAGHNDSDDTDTISVQQKISALVFTTKVGGEVYDMHLSSAVWEKSWLHLPDLFTLTFGNNGNVHVVPRGRLKIIAPNGKVVSQGTVNEGSAYVLPETSRQVAVQTQKISSDGWRPGRYKVTVDYRYDGHAGFASKSYTFVYVNPIGIAAVLLALIVGCYVVYRLLKTRKINWRRLLQK
jgi:hypothetical protein